MAPKKKPRMDVNQATAILKDTSFHDFLKMKAKQGDAGIHKLLGDFSKQKKEETCIFCGTMFNPSFPGHCSVEHDVDWTGGEYTGARGMSSYMHSGTCATCGEEVEAEGGDDEPPYDIPICYAGLHVSSYPEGYGDDVDDGSGEDDAE